MALFGGAGGIVGGAVVRLTLDDSQFRGGLAQAEGETRAAAGGMSKFGGAAKAGFAIAGAAAVAFAASSLKAFAQAQQVMAQTEAVLKSTGGAANVTADDVVNLANEIRNLSGIDDEAVQASENLLLTFRDVHNEVGKGNDIFNQTTLAIADMATAMNQGAIPSQEQLAQTTIQVGKAMNDPIQGMTALRRVGVTFNATQVETITRLEQSGHLMQAQKMILAELSAEFGGAAEAAGNTFAGSMAKASAKLGDLKEGVGAFLGSELLALTGDLGAASRLWVELGNATDGAVQHLAEVAQAAGLDASAVGHLTAEQEAARTEMQHTTREQAILTASLAAGQSAASQSAFATQGLAAAMRQLNDQMRTAWSLTNQAAGGLVGLVSADMDAKKSRSELAAAQAKVNTLIANGKQGTNAYAQAIRDRNAAEIQSIQSQQNLEGSAQSLYAEFRKGNVSLAEADSRLRAQAASAGLSASRTNDLVSRVNALYAADSKIPKDVKTNFDAPGLQSQLSSVVAYWTTLKNIPTHIDVTITTNYKTTGNPTTKGPS